MNDNELAEKFENCTLAGADFTHRNHVRLAWIYLHKFKPLDALERFSENLKNSPPRSVRRIFTTKQ